MKQSISCSSRLHSTSPFAHTFADEEQFFRANHDSLFLLLSPYASVSLAFKFISPAHLAADAFPSSEAMATYDQLPCTPFP